MTRFPKSEFSQQPRSKQLTRNLDRLWIKKLTTLPPQVYTMVVKRLLHGQTTREVAKWLFELKPTGECQDLSFEQFRRYLGPLKVKVLNHAAAVKHSFKIRNFSVQASINHVAGVELSTALLIPVEPDVASPIMRKVSKAMSEMEISMKLNYAFATQMERVEAIRADEMNQPQILHQGDGNKALSVLNEIAGNLLRYELGVRALTVKNPTYGVTEPAQEPEPDSLAARFSKLDEVDRNLVRTATSHVIDMIRETASGQFTSDGLEPNPNRTPGT